MGMQSNAIKYIFSFLLLCGMQVPAQPTGIHYGNNPGAGKYYHIRGINLYCEVYGKGKPLLLIHGNGGSISDFKNNIPYFAKHFKVIVADSRAQGKTMDNGDSLSFQMMADDMAALLTAMHIYSADIIGWSDGGIIALLIAMRHPGKVKKIAVTGANLWPDSTAIIPSLWKEMQQQYEAGKNRALTSAKEKNDWKLFLLDWLQPHIELTQLHSIHCPSLVIAGDHDLIVTKHTVDIFENIPNAQLWILPNSSHGTLIDHADEFNRKVYVFFRR